MHSADSNTVPRPSGEGMSPQNLRPYGHMGTCDAAVKTYNLKSHS